MDDASTGLHAGVQVPGRAAGGPTSAPDARVRRDARAWLLDVTLGSLDERAALWLCDAMAAADDERATDIAFGSAPRRTGRERLDVSATDLDRPSVRGWRPGTLRADRAARMLIALAHAEHDRHAVERLLRHADVEEECALYAALWLYPEPTRLHEAVGRGLRTHAPPVFEAIAHANPWPAAHLDEHRWNHLVLKALFIGAALEPVLGLDERANPTLARMLLDFADERRAAGREVPAELWRCALPFAPPERLVPHRATITNRY